MARFIAAKWEDGASSWSIILRDRSAASLAERVAVWMVDNPPSKTSTIGFARVPPGVDAEYFVSTLPPPDLSGCPLCAAGSWTDHTSGNPLVGRIFPRTVH